MASALETPDNDYTDIDRRLKLAQFEIGKALSSLSADDIIAHTNDVRLTEHVDFFSIFSEVNDLRSSSSSIDERNNTSLCTSTSTTTTNARPGHHSVPAATAAEAADSPARRPDRPTTLARPVPLPTCCNFRRQPWTTYVHGEFSYASTPRFYDGVDGEIQTAERNDDVVRIMDELQRYGGRLTSAEKVEKSSGKRTADHPVNHSTGGTCRNGIKVGATTRASHIDEQTARNNCRNDAINSKSRGNLSANAGGGPEAIGLQRQHGETSDRVTSSTSGGEGSRTSHQDINQNVDDVHKQTASTCTGRRVADTGEQRRLESASKEVKAATQRNGSPEMEEKLRPTYTGRRDVASPRILESATSHAAQSGEVMVATVDRVDNVDAVQPPPPSPPPPLPLNSRRGRNRSLQHRQTVDSKVDSTKSSAADPAQTGSSYRRSRTLSPVEHHPTDDDIRQLNRKKKKPAAVAGFIVPPPPASKPPETNGTRRGDGSSRVLSSVVDSPLMRRLGGGLRYFRRGGRTADEDAAAVATSNSHATSGGANGSLPAIEENDPTVQRALSDCGNRSRRGLDVDVLGRKPLPPRRSLSSSSSSASSTLSDNGCSNNIITSSETRGETLLDAMHKKFYPSQYAAAADRTRSAEFLGGGCAADPAAAARTGNGVTAMQSASTMPRLSTSKAPPPLKILQNDADSKRQPEVGRVTSRTGSNGTHRDAAVSICASDLTLMDCCRWLIAAGFPQYVQLFAENQLKKSDVETLADDHRDIETSFLQMVETRLNQLLRFAQSKSTNTDALYPTTGSTTAPTGVTCSTAHSRHWHYDRLCRRWLRSANSTSGSQFPTSTSGFRPLSLRRRSTTGSSGSRQRQLDSPSSSLIDTGNHVTSGYESENSPTSTATRTDDCPPTSPSDSSPSSVCSCTSTSSSSPGTGFVVEADDPAIDVHSRRRRMATTAAVSPVLEVDTRPSPLRTTCTGRISLNGVSDVLEGRHHVTSPCSATTTSPSSTSNGFTDESRSTPDDSTILAGYQLGVTSTASFSDSTMLNGFTEVPASASSPQIRPAAVTVSSSTPALQAADGRHGRGGNGAEKRSGAAVRSRSSCTDSERPPRSSSFYDNLSVSEVLADPQAELELILDDLRRNISALDAALGTPPSEQSPCSPLSVAIATETPTSSGSVSSSSGGQLRVSTSTTSAQPSGTTPCDAPSPAASLDSGCVVVMETNARGATTSASRQDSTRSNGVGKQRGSRTDMKNGRHSLPLHTDSRPRDRKSQRSSDVDDWWLERAAPLDVTDDVKSVTSLSAWELGIVRQLCLMDLTVQFEKHCSNRQTSTDIINRLTSMFSMTSQPDVDERRNKDGGVTQNRVFGAVVGDQLRRSGRAVPRCISRAMKLVLDQADDADGVFRRPGVASRVQKLQDDMGREPDAVEFDGDSDVYSVADVIKRYFRDMPESVLTDNLSNILVDIYTYLPEKVQWPCVQSAFVLLPDANRTAACQLLAFLHGVAQHTAQNQMNASNLAVCFLPSLFRINDYHQMAAPIPAPANSNSGGGGGGGSGRESNQNRYKSAVTCLRLMIENAPSLTQVPDRILPALRNYDKDGGDTLRIEPYYSVSVSTHLQRLFDELRVNAADETYHGVNDWINCKVDTNVNHVDGRRAAEHIISVSRRSTLDDDCGLHVWRVTVNIGAPPVEVLDRLRQSATDWDPAVQRWNVLEQLDNNVDLVEFSLTLHELERRRCFRVVRSWRSDQSTGRCMLVSTSVASDLSSSSNSRQSDSISCSGEVEGRLLADHYVIEPCGTGMSRLTHVSCVDFSGHTVDWYQSIYARLCCSRVSLIRDSFRQPTKWTRGPETKV